jgi:putative DNA primase/helicase
MTDLSKIFGGPFKVATKVVEPPEVQLREAIKKEGLIPPDVINIDGEIHRFNSDDKGKNAGFYVAYPDGVPSGVFGCWRAGTKINWRADIGRDLTPEELRESRAAIERAKNVREQELKRRREQTRREVDAIWKQGIEANDDHPYLKKKKVKAHGVKVNNDGRLMVPLYDESYQLSSLQYIDESGGKLYHQGGRVGGCYFTIGMPTDTIYVVEGFATGATVREVTGSMVVVAFSASNLPIVRVLWSGSEACRRCR